MEPTTSIITAFVERQAEAPAALDRIRDAAIPTRISVVAAAVITLEGTDGALRLHVEADEERAGPNSRKFIDVLFPPSVLSLPAVGRQAAVVADHYGSLGIQANLAREIGENLPPVGAAVVVVVAEEWLMAVDDVLSPHGVHRYSLEREAITRRAGVSLEGRVN